LQSLSKPRQKELGRAGGGFRFRPRGTVFWGGGCGGNWSRGRGEKKRGGFKKGWFPANSRSRKPGKWVRRKGHVKEGGGGGTDLGVAGGRGFSSKARRS